MLRVCGVQQQPAVLPTSSVQPPAYTTPSSQAAAAYDAGTEDIRRRQEELEKKAAELERRERAMQQSVQGHSECLSTSFAQF